MGAAGIYFISAENGGGGGWKKIGFLINKAHILITDMCNICSICVQFMFKT